MLHELTLSNLKSYAGACAQLCMAFIELGEQGFTAMVVPSRGAAPLAEAASSYFHSEWKPLHAPGADRLAAIRDYTLGPMVGPLYLPFTADIPSSETGIESRDIRRFWTAVLAAIVTGNRTCPYYRFFEFLRSRVCKVGFAHRYEDRTIGGRFLFLDTVVSGRAICEIADAFDEFGLTEAHFVLVIDANGARLKPRYAHRIDALERAGRATIVYLDRLFTEDQGPAVSGMWSVTMPDIMDIARTEIPVFKNSGAVGAGLYYPEIRAREDKSNLPTTRSIAQLSFLINFTWSSYISDDWLEYDLGELRTHLTTHDLINIETTITTARPVLERASQLPMSLASSSSHAIRLNHDRDAAAALVRQFRF